MPKLNLPSERKDFLRQNFNSVDPETLPKDERTYYNLIKAGKSRAKKSIRLEGKFVSGEIVDIIEKVAKKKGLSLKRYIDQNSEDIMNLVNSGYTHVFKRVDDVIDLVSGSKKKFFYVNDGNGLLRLNKAETIKQLAEFQNYVKTNSDIVEIMIRVKIYKTGRIEITIPRKRKQAEEEGEFEEQEFYDDFDHDKLMDFLDEFDDIEYIVSDQTAKGG